MNLAILLMGKKKQTIVSRSVTRWGVASLLCFMLLFSPAFVNAGELVEIEAPDTVGVGKPFLVSIASWYPLDNVRVQWNGKTMRPTVVKQDGKSNAIMLLGIGLRGKIGTYTIALTADIWGHERRFVRNVTVVESTWGKETLRVPPKMVKPPEEVLARIKQERELIQTALNTVSPQRYWDVPFSRPAKGKMLSRFGLYRIFNGDTKGRHTGLDFRAWMGTPLYAMASGKILLVGNFYYAGNAVFIDHGNGLISLSAHMSKVLVSEGDMVEAGQKIGLSGATGRVNGAHLHLGTFVLGKPVDPELFFDGSFEQKQSKNNKIR